MIGVNESHDRLRSHNFIKFVEKVKSAYADEKYYHKRKNHYKSFYLLSFKFLNLKRLGIFQFNSHKAHNKAHCAKSYKRNNERKSRSIHHLISFKFLTCFMIATLKKISKTETKITAEVAMMICHISRLLKLINKYAHIEKSAVKNAKVKVFNKSKYNFIFSINKIIADENKFNLKGKVCFISF